MEYKVVTTELKGADEFVLGRVRAQASTARSLANGWATRAGVVNGRDREIDNSLRRLKKHGLIQYDRIWRVWRPVQEVPRG